MQTGVVNRMSALAIFVIVAFSSLGVGVFVTIVCIATCAAEDDSEESDDDDRITTIVVTPAVSTTVLPYSATLCAICLDTFADDAHLLACGHAFHNDCIRRSLKRQARCPVCMRDAEALLRHVASWNQLAS
jgi:hypothetical protein